jgi:hypothetical protein
MPCRNNTRVSSHHAGRGELAHHDCVIWVGDMNYRVSSSDGGVADMLIKNDMYDELLQNCQLNTEKKI